MTTKITLYAIVSPIVTDRFMHDADMFEPFKVLIKKPFAFSGTMKPGNTTETCIEKSRAALQRDGKFRVVALWRDGDATGAYHDTSVKSVSFGTKWCIFGDLLHQLGYPGN